MEDDERESQRATHREKNKQTNKQTKKQKKNVENGLTADRSGGGEAGVLLSVGQVVAAVAVRRAVLVVGRVRRAADDVGQRQFRRRGRQFGNVIRHVIHRRRRRRGAATPLDGLQRHGPQVDASADLQVLQPLQRRSVQLQRSRLAIKESGPEKSKKKKKKTRKKNERWFVRLVQFSPSSFRFSLVSIRVSFSFHFFFRSLPSLAVAPVRSGFIDWLVLIDSFPSVFILFFDRVVPNLEKTGAPPTPSFQRPPTASFVALSSRLPSFTELYRAGLAPRNANREETTSS